MKNIFIMILLFIFFAIIYPIYAAEDRQPKTVSGKVRNADLSVAKNVEVFVTCDTITRTDTTSVNGNYSVTFANLECEQFDTAVVNVSNVAFSGTATKGVTFALNVTMPDIILQTISTDPTPTNTPIPETTISVSPSPEVSLIETQVASSVPEFNVLTGLIATGGSILAYVKIKKKE